MSRKAAELFQFHKVRLKVQEYGDIQGVLLHFNSIRYD